MFNINLVSKTSSEYMQLAVVPRVGEFIRVADDVFEVNRVEYLVNNSDCIAELNVTLKSKKPAGFSLNRS